MAGLYLLDLSEGGKEQRCGTLMAVMMSRFCRLWLLEKEEFCSTIFSSSSISSAWRPACMKLFTATDTCSGFLDSGSAVDTTCHGQPSKPSVILNAPCGLFEA